MHLHHVQAQQVKTRLWPHKVDGRAFMVSELPPDEFALQVSSVIQEIFDAMDAEQRAIVYAHPSVLDNVRVSAITLMVIRNASRAAKTKTAK